MSDIKVGDKLRLPHWEQPSHLIVKAIDGDEFWGEIHPKSSWATSPIRATYGLNAGWVPYVEPPTVVEVRNAWCGGFGFPFASREEADKQRAAHQDWSSGIKWTAVVTVMSDGSVTAEDLR